VFHELIGMTGSRAVEAFHTIHRWFGYHPAYHPPNSNCRPGLSPHAPYSARHVLFSLAQSSAVPVATHLAETQAELELLRDHAGPFVAFLKEVDAWDPPGLIADPLAVVRALPAGIFVHANYLDPATAFTPDQSIVVCPRTHAAFGHPRHPFPRMNVRVALGTDSLASNPDLDILAEARFLRVHYAEVAPAALLRMLTLNGAEALGFHDVAGSLTAGKSADLVVLPLPDAEPLDPHDLVLRSALPVARVMFGGAWTQ
jgi:cytosine/adenosine deaminase-related metal-dependent hydrolase